MPELSSVVESAKTEYQGEVVEINFDDSSRNGCYLSDGKSVMESHEEDPGWWEEAVKFADSIENIEHISDLCYSVSSTLGSLLLILLCSVCPAVIAYRSTYLQDDDDFWMNAERIMEQIEGQKGSQSNT
jgi:DNA-directed primase/polymerase protein